MISELKNDEYEIRSRKQIRFTIKNCVFDLGTILTDRFDYVGS